MMAREIHFEVRSGGKHVMLKKNSVGVGGRALARRLPENKLGKREFVKILKNKNKC
jgi:hypothetical protein